MPSPFLKTILGASVLAAGAAVAAAAPAAAATETVTLPVSDMSCAACPITVKQSLLKVDGVSKVDVSLQQHNAVVTFDDTRTNVNQLTAATKDVGYPSNVQP